MSISAAVLTSGSNLGSGSSATTGIFTTTANHLVLLWVLCSYASGPNVSPANVNGLTWVNMFDANIYNLGGNRTIGLWRAMASSGGSGTMGLSFDVNTNIAWHILDFGDVDTTGSNGSGAVTQSNQQYGTGTNNVSLSATSASNAIVGLGSGFDGNTVCSVGSGFTSLGTFTDFSAINAAYLIQWLNGVSQSVSDMGINGGSAGRQFALEVNAGSAPAPTTGAPSGLVVGAGF